MGRYRKIDPRIWNDEKFYTASLSCQHLFFFILTHPQMTAVGAMRCTLAGLREELDWEDKGFPEGFTEAFKEGCSKGFWKHDGKAKFLWVPKFIKYNTPESPNVIRAWVRCWDDLPECGLKNLLYQKLKGYVEGLNKGFAEAFEEVMPKDYALSGAGAVTGAVIKKKDTSTADAADPPADPKPKNCPHSEIISIYHEILPERPRMVESLWAGSQSATNLRQRWKQSSEHQSLEWWRGFFEAVRQNDWWMGRDDWKGVDLHWLLKRDNFRKVVEFWNELAEAA